MITNLLEFAEGVQDWMVDPQIPEYQSLSMRGRFYSKLII